MFHWNFRTSHIQFTLLLGVMAAFFVICIVLFPDQAFKASLQGLHIWWKITFPALLPFLILSELLIAYGILHFLGVWLEPLMRLLFRLPGMSGTVLAIGYTVGFPAGAPLTKQLREKKIISRNEGERLLALSHTASPIFILNVIAVGFFQNVQIGFILIIIQVVSIIAMGIIMRFFLLNDSDTNSEIRKLSPHNEISNGLLRKSVNAMYAAHSEDGRTFGKLLGDAVNSSIQTLMMIGGFIMIFSVILQIMTVTQITNVLYAGFHNIIPEPVSLPLIKGIFEIHLGSFAFSQVEAVPFLWKMTMISALLAWSGLAMHAQVKSVTHHTDLRYTTFLISRLLQTILAIWFTLWLWTPLTRMLDKVQPGFQHSFAMNEPVLDPFPLGYVWGGTALLMICLMGAMILISLLILFIEQITNHLKT